MLRNGIWLSVIIMFVFTGCSFRPFERSNLFSLQGQPSNTLNSNRMGNELVGGSGQEVHADGPELTSGSFLAPQLAESKISQDKLIDKVDADQETKKLTTYASGDRFGISQQPDSISEEELVYDLPMIENSSVKRFIDYYSGDGKKTFSIWMERSARYLPMMQEIFSAEGLPPDLTYLAMVESGFND